LFKVLTLHICMMPTSDVEESAIWVVTNQRFFLNKPLQKLQGHSIAVKALSFFTTASSCETRNVTPQVFVTC
jgi:hypothetical protein